MLAYLLIICVAFFVVATSLIRLVGEYLFQQKVREEQRIAETLAMRVAAPWGQYDARTLYAQTREVAAQNGSRVMVLDLNGVVQVDSESQYNGNRLKFGEVASVLNGNGGTYGFYGLGDSAWRNWLGIVGGFSDNTAVVGLYSAPIMVADRLSGVLVYITLSQDVFQNLTLIQRQIMIWLVLVAVAVAILSLFVVSRMINRPVEELNQGIARMAQGDLSSRVVVRGHSEFAQLAEAFNMMCERLEVLDHARNQFVSNASHELKTPLSTMKILIETLLYQEGSDPAMQKEFLQDANREIDRLNSIISDLLTLVHIDSGNMKLRLSTIKLNDIIADTVKRLFPLSVINEIQLECVMNDQIEATMDSMKIQQVVYNLIDNAIKYTPKGGAVKVELTRVGKKAVLRVSDTGIGIPKADIIHVFDRFYRVDKARSRETGGTGLGLSIVKQIVLLHGGTISVASEENVGSTFTVELPIENV